MTLIIGIGNRMQAGKDTFAYYLQTALYEQSRVSTEIHSFAGPLKKVMQTMFGCSHAGLYGDGGHRNLPVSDFAHKSIRRGSRMRVRRYLDEPNMTHRQAMQQFGCQMRDQYPGIWVNATLSKTFLAPVVLIPDMRFKDEFRAIKKAGGRTIQITRGTPPTATHYSESLLDDADYDLHIHNNAGLKELRHTANMVAKWLVKDFDLTSKTPSGEPNEQP